MSRTKRNPADDLPPRDPQASPSGLDNLISPLDPSRMSRAEDDEVVFEHSPEFSDRPGQGKERRGDRDAGSAKDDALTEGPGPAEGRTDNKAGG